MDNIGDWLYIVLILAAGLSGLFSSGKKKKQQTSMPGPPHDEVDPDASAPAEKGFWEILQEMQQGETPAPQPVPSPVNQKKIKKITKPSSSTSTSFLPKSDLFDYKETKIHPMEDSSTSALADEDFHNTDELRKAVIYSEILNRKY